MTIHIINHYILYRNSFLKKCSILFVVLIVLAGCAGRNFVRPSSDAFTLGQTTYSQIIQQMGEPRSVGEVLKNGKKVKSITYSYATTVDEPSEDGVIPARGLIYYFSNDTLVGQQFISSFKTDNSNFDDTKIANITKGQSTRTDVIQQLGKPSGSSIPPMVKETSGEAIVYMYATTRGGVYSGFKLFSKKLTITFDDRILVSDIDYESSDNK